MRKFWLTLFATALLLIGGAATAGAQMHGGRGGGFHGGHFHGGRFNNFHTNFRVFFGAPFFWWGAAYYPYYYPYSYFGGSYASPIYGDPGSATYVQQYSGTAAQSGGGEYWYYCTAPVGYYPQVRDCAKSWLRVVPDGSRMR